MTDQDDDLTFESLEPASVPVRVADGRTFTLREATEADAAAYRNAQVGATRFGKDGKPTGVGDIASADAMLLGRCLLDAEGKPVGAQALRGWGSSATRRLFKRLVRMSGLEDEAKAAEPAADGQQPQPAEALAAKNGRASEPTGATSA